MKIKNLYGYTNVLSSILGFGSGTVHYIIHEIKVKFVCNLDIDKPDFTNFLRHINQA